MSRAGGYDRRVQIYSPTVTRDATSGQPKESFALWKTVWARLVAPRAVSEDFATASLHARLQTIWRMRYVSGLLDTMRIHHGGRIHKIIGISEVVRKTELEVTTEVYE